MFFEVEFLELGGEDYIGKMELAILLIIGLLFLLSFFLVLVGTRLKVLA